MIVALCYSCFTSRVYHKLKWLEEKQELHYSTAQLIALGKPPCQEMDKEGVC